jgi:hypothetical protein
MKVGTGEQTKGFFGCAFFLNWGVDYRIKSSKTKFGKIASWTFNHPISHCGADTQFWDPCTPLCSNPLNIHPLLSSMNKTTEKYQMAYQFLIFF